jgi:hypothetical protein
VAKGVHARIFIKHAESRWILQLPAAYHPLLPSPPTAGAAAVITANLTRLSMKTC